MSYAIGSHCYAEIIDFRISSYIMGRKLVKSRSDLSEDGQSVGGVCGVCMGPHCQRNFLQFFSVTEDFQT